MESVSGKALQVPFDPQFVNSVLPYSLSTFTIFWEYWEGSGMVNGILEILRYVG